MVKYSLMHKNSICGMLVLDEITGRIVDYKDYGTGISPFLGNADLPKMKKWWEMRAVPATRDTIHEILKQSGCLNTEVYLAKNLALSMTDSYWVRPVGSQLQYEQVNFRNLQIYYNGKIPYHNATSYDYNASLGGQMEKYWNLDHPIPDLVKESSKYYGQQSVNEVIATKIHLLQKTDVPFVKYTAEAVAGHGIVSHCDAFTGESVELVSAYEIVESQKAENSKSLYEHYIDLCVQHGIEWQKIQKFMDYQTLTDFIISNTDEHLANFGVLRNVDTMEFIGPAPIFDSGNSMFYNEDRTVPYSRRELLERPITSFYKTEEKMLGKIMDRSVVNLDLLPSPQEISILYIQAGIPEKKADFISKNYQTKIEMAQEFQRGKTISMYQEKIKERQKKYTEPVSKQVMLIVSHTAGAETDEQIQEFRLDKEYIENTGFLYPIEQAIEDTSFILDRNKVLSCPKNDAYKGTVLKISMKDIQNELSQSRVPNNKSLSLWVAEVRIKKALVSGANVIFESFGMSAAEQDAIKNFIKTIGVDGIQLRVTQETFSQSEPVQKRKSIEEQILQAKGEMHKTSVIAEKVAAQEISKAIDDETMH